MKRQLVTDELWKRIEPLIPQPPPDPRGGRFGRGLHSPKDSLWTGEGQSTRFRDSVTLCPLELRSPAAGRSGNPTRMFVINTDPSGQAAVRL
jgi:hypothetical protein